MTLAKTARNQNDVFARSLHSRCVSWQSLLIIVALLVINQPASAHDPSQSLLCSSLEGSVASCDAATKFYMDAARSRAGFATSHSLDEEQCADSFSGLLSGVNSALKQSDNRKISQLLHASDLLATLCRTHPVYVKAVDRLKSRVRKMYDDGGGPSIQEGDMVVQAVPVTGADVPFSGNALNHCMSGATSDCTKAVKTYATAASLAANTGHLAVACDDMAGEMKASGQITLMETQKVGHYITQMGDAGFLMQALHTSQAIEKFCPEYNAKSVEEAIRYRKVLKSRIVGE